VVSSHGSVVPGFGNSSLPGVLAMWSARALMSSGASGTIRRRPVLVGPTPIAFVLTQSVYPKARCSVR
jgi:hypothetical protein